MYRIISLLTGYLIGCIQTAYFVGRLHGIDIRDHGSKNAGMTNVTRTIGKKAGLFVFIIDVLKAVAAFLIARFVFGEPLFGIYAGIGAVLGHCFPVFLKFRGGKGVSCALGLIILTDWRIALIAFALGIVAVIITRYISLGSLIVTLTVPVVMIFFDAGIEAIGLMSFLAALIWFLHRQNIKRLAKGEERKFLSKD